MGCYQRTNFIKKHKILLYTPMWMVNIILFEEFTDKIKDSQKDKDGKTIYLYASNKDAQHAYIQTAKDKGYDVLFLDSPIVSHLIQKLEMDNKDISFARVDADHIDKLINKDEKTASKLNDKEKEKLKGIIENNIDKSKYTIQMESLDSSESPFVITLPEFMRRMKEMQQTGGGAMGMFGGNMPETYNLVVNSNHDLMNNVLNSEDATKQKQLITQMLDLAMLSQNLLQGEALTNFVKRSYELI